MIAISGVIVSHLVALLMWYLVLDEEYRKSIERGDFWKR